MTSKDNPTASKSIRDWPRLRLDEVFGSLPSNGVSLTAEQMDDAISEAVAGRHAPSMRWARSTKATSRGR